MNRLTSLLMILVAALTLAACDTQPQSVGQLPTQLVLPTLTDAPPPSATATASATVQASPTFTGTQPATDLPTLTPSNTITDTPTLTPTATEPPPYVPGLLDFLAQTAAVQTVLPPTFAPQGGIPTLVGNGTVSPVETDEFGMVCPAPPAGGFALVYLGDPALPAQLGCPINGTLTVNQPAAVQAFERGTMVWVQGTPNYIYVLYNSGTYQRFIDTWQSGETAPISEMPPPGLSEPLRGFGKVWRDNPTVKSTLGWAVAIEAGTAATRQDFERGTMLNVTLRADIVSMYHTGDPAFGAWRASLGNY